MAILIEKTNGESKCAPERIERITVNKFGLSPAGPDSVPCIKCNLVGCQLRRGGGGEVGSTVGTDCRVTKFNWIYRSVYGFTIYREQSPGVLRLYVYLAQSQKHQQKHWAYDHRGSQATALASVMWIYMGSRGFENGPPTLIDSLKRYSGEATAPSFSVNVHDNGLMLNIVALKICWNCNIYFAKY